MELPLDRLSLERALLERFHSSEISEGYVRSEIRESWRRCLDCGLTPANRPGSAGLARGELNDLREQNAILLRFAKRELKKLQAQIPGRNYLISFANADAVLLDVVSDTSQPAEPTSEVVPGVRWNETTYGTNAIGLAALEK